MDEKGDVDHDGMSICSVCLNKVLTTNSPSSFLPVYEIKEGNNDLTCVLCYGVLQSNGSLLEAAFRCVKEFQVGGHKQFFVSVHVPDVVFLNYFLWDQLLSTGDSIDDSKLPANVQFFVDTKRYPVKDYFREMLCDALNVTHPDVFTDDSGVSNGPSLKVVIIPPKPNTYSFLLPEKAALKPSAKKMKISVENGNDIDRQCFIDSVNSVLQHQSLPREQIVSLLLKSMASSGQVQFQLSVHIPSIFIGGRYLKFSRSLSQTPWFINGKRKGDLSVEELISQPLKDFCKCENSFFRSSGREDVDVQMLGNGRPFVVELVQPRKFSFEKHELENIERVINTQALSQVEVRVLHLVPKQNLIHLRDGEKEKSKEYLALLFCKDSPFSESDLHKLKLCDVEICQKTPLRVLHRRALLNRKRKILWCEPCLVENNPHYMKLQLASEAGTYIKEWVHGDLGRTKPSVSDILGRKIDIVQLDVANVNLEWPLNHD